MMFMIAQKVIFWFQGWNGEEAAPVWSGRGESSGKLQSESSDNSNIQIMIFDRRCPYINIGQNSNF